MITYLSFLIYPGVSSCLSLLLLLFLSLSSLLLFVGWGGGGEGGEVITYLSFLDDLSWCFFFCLSLLLLLFLSLSLLLLLLRRSLLLDLCLQNKILQIKELLLVKFIS